MTFIFESVYDLSFTAREVLSTLRLFLELRRRHPLSDSYRSRTNIQSDVWKGATSNKRQHTPPTPTLQAAAVNTFGKNDGTSIQPPREHLRGKSHAQRKERRTPDVTLNEAPMHTSDAERRDRSLTDMARIISSTNVQAGSQKSDRVPHGVDSIISHTGESVSGASNFIRSHIDSAVRLLTRLTIGEMKNSSNSETEQLAIPQHLSESMRDGSNDELGALPSHNFSSTTTGSGIHDRVKKNSARIPSGLIGSDRVKNVLELDVDEEVYSLLCKQDVCKQDVTHTHARSSPSLHRRRHSVYDIPVSLLDTHALVPNFSHLQPSDMPSHTQHQSTPNIYPLNCDSGGRETADSPSTHTTTRDMTRDRKSSGHTPKTVENTPLRRVEKRNNTAHSTAEASRTFVRIKRTDTGHVIQLARSCPVTADGFKAATSRGLKHLHLAYDLGYRSCTVLGIPLLQRVDYNVYAVFNGVSEVSPFGFVHMTVKKREHVVQRSADDDWETQMHQPKFVHAKSSQEGSGRGSLRSSGSMSDLYRNVDERADSRQGISRPEKSISSLNLRGLARMHVTDDDGVRDKVFDWESNKPGREIGAGYPRWASTEGLSMGADLAQARSNSQLPQRPLPNTVFGFRSPSPGLDTRDGRDGSLSVQGPLAQAEFEITCDCTKPVKSRPRHMPLASRADTNRTAGWGNDAHERADGHTQSSTRVQPDTPANKYAATNDLLRTAAHPYASVREGENGGEHRYNASPSTTDPDAQGRECTLGEASDRYCVHGTCFLWHLHSLEVEDKHVPLEQKALPPYEDMEMALLLLGNGASGGGI
ncbi:hypothetical protein SARC_09716 [Sphaeroforma arctica JP610]|uniref:Uncharacterized protein n=1 Tax=Sphaeroforma arctica JP610 TaxID=667725 RepID=A0A0L0FMT6_9EUKA|nr:hypothetical protein SARC_09716 [Sphaeroforma arctica JP610]KNC77831.1 hypothetical protein SARC_09716 [Sphaeroforma arctica JP610]|eukprot:XP_014151733.1 hypothetical protein SARC_09716 [Sphaeroforma arctica JP610]